MGIFTRFIRTSYLHPGEQTMVPVKSLFFSNAIADLFGILQGSGKIEKKRKLKKFTI